MYLKSIILKGFKSFPERTRLEFGAGVSVIVGPNGSGKSNVTDAVLWALGEQSPVAVRGQSMQDVIFGGAPGRQAARSAEVELVLDDSEQTLGLGRPEVSIVRRLDRSGEGEYRLSGARCRLVDVIEVLSDTGLGKEMHSVISQGRVEAIVTSKPRDRRLLIEEAAGLGKHRKRRRRAQLKLARTQDNLDRALDVEREARSRLRPLKRQAEAAELHARLERQIIEVSWERSRDEVRAAGEGLREAEARAAQARQRRETLERELLEVAARREQAEEQLAARSAQREELSRRCFVAQNVQQQITYRAEGIAAGAQLNKERLESARRLQARLNEGESTTEKTDGLDERIAALEQELAVLERDRRRQVDQQLAELRQRLQTAAQTVEVRSAEIQRANAARAEREHELEHQRGALREAEREVEAARRRAAEVGAELAAVNRFLRGHQRPPRDVSALSSELEVEPGFELAVAAALDGRLAAALVGDLGVGRSLLDRAGPDGGRALVLGAGDGAAPGGSVPQPGAQCLAEKVRGSDGAREVARMLLRDTWLVEDVEQLPTGFNGVAVTRSGRVWSATTRELRQAPVAGDDRLLAERNRRDALIEQSESAARAEHSARRELERLGNELEALELARAQAVDEQHAAMAAQEDANDEHRRIQSLIDRRSSDSEQDESAVSRQRVEAQLAAERLVSERLEDERIQRQKQREHLLAAIGAYEELEPALESVRAALESAADAVASTRDGFESALSTDRQAGEHLTEELRSCAQEEAALHGRLHAENESLTALEVDAQRARDHLADTEEALRGYAGRLELDATPRGQPLSEEEGEALAARLTRLERRREQLGPVNPIAGEEYAEAVEHVEELERQREDLEGALRELEKLIADTDRQIRETFEATFEAAARNFEDVAEQLFPGGKGGLTLVAERERQARVLGAQSEVGDPSAEPAANAAETEELEELDPEEDRLGVEIEITPAGKEMKRLSLLSGGEKSMTALAFLFAVFLAKPCPFYILDEVEVALDDLNIDRFLGLLRRYSETAQFIVVTHQKRTMDAADSLYGVSMGGDGISKVISRRLPAEQAAA
jgi:chromosome segregation protein